MCASVYSPYKFTAFLPSVTQGVPRGREKRSAAGFAFVRRYCITKSKARKLHICGNFILFRDLRAQRRVVRAAEQLVFSAQTTGAANDLQRATSLARNMVSQYGMSKELGLMTTATVQNSYLDGQAYMDCSQDTAAQVDREVQKLLDGAFADATRILKENRGLLDEISEYLLVKETITGEELMAYVNAAQEPKRELPASEENA